MALSWSGRRKMLYSGVTLIVAFLLLVLVYETFFTTAPTCFDGKQNGDEAGIDCGGGCSLVCPDLARSPIVLWARSFSVGGNAYTAAAYVQNNNVGAGARLVKYSFQLFDSNNLLVVERDGVTELPPVQLIPIIEPNISVGNRVVTRTLFAFSEAPIWQKVPKANFPILHTSEQNVSNDASVLSAKLTNDTQQDIKNVTVAAVLFDQDGVARAASKSLIDMLPRQSSEPVVFTWPGGVPNIVRAEITVLPSF